MGNCIIQKFDRHYFVKSFVHPLIGFLPPVGQDIIALSGGQRAIIGLTRAIYQKYQVNEIDDHLWAFDRHVSK